MRSKAAKTGRNSKSTAIKRKPDKDASVDDAPHVNAECRPQPGMIGAHD